jgi:D-amino peptidase
MHPMSDTIGGCLAHTMSGIIKAYRINGRAVGEMEIAAYLAGELGIPWIFTSGDLHACREADEWVPGITVAAVKEGLGTNAAIHLAPVDARKLIKAKVQEAVANASRIEPLVAEPPVTLEIERREPGPAELGPGAERVDAFTVRWTGPSLWHVFHLATYGCEVPLPEPR